MSAIVIRGREVAGLVLDDVAARVRARLESGRSRPRLAVVLVGHDPASETYVRGKRQDAERVGIAASDHRLPETAGTEDVLELVGRLNQDESISGILVQQPLPAVVEVAAVVAAVDPARDVDGFHPVNAGRLLLGQPGLRPCTPAGVLRMLDFAGIDPAGKRAVVVGRSNLVGKPVAVMLLARDATVTVCHSRTRDLGERCREAELLVVAIGRPHFVKPEMVRPGAVVVDVGVTPVAGKVQGDVDPAVAEVAGWITPVPGGVGLMTRAMLMANTLAAEIGRAHV